MTPTERAKRAITDSDLEECITAAVQAERNAGDLRLADATAALQAALEELARVKQERDGLAVMGLSLEPMESFDKRKMEGLTVLLLSAKGEGWHLMRVLPDEYSYDFVDRDDTYYMRSLYSHFMRMPCHPMSSRAEQLAAILSAHDRQVAARVLRREAAEWRKSSDITHRAFAAGLIDSAEEYEAGEREVPK